MAGGSGRAVVEERAAGSRMRLAQQQLAFLAEASSLLAASLDYHTTLANVARLPVPTLADWCVLDLVDDESGPRDTPALRRVAVAHVDPNRAALAQEIQRQPPDPRRGDDLLHLLRSGRALLAPSIAEAQPDATPGSAALLALSRAVGATSFMAVPLAASRGLGVMTLIAAESGRRYGPADLALAEELARYAAQALENARLYRRAERALVETRILHEVALRLHGASDLDVALATIAEAAARLVDAEIAGVNIVEGNEMVVRQGHGLPPEALGQRTPMEGSLAGLIHRHGQPLISNDLASDPRAYQPNIQVLGLRSYLGLPLAAGGERLGVLWVANKRAGHFSDDDIRPLATLATEAAMALENASLARAAHEARAARELDRLKARFIATVSHELRTPLSLVMGYGELLRDRDIPRDEAREMAGQIVVGAQRLSQLINDLLLFSEQEAGRLVLHPQRLALPEIVREVVQEFKRQSQHRFVVDVEPELPVVFADPRRLRQVLTNLVSNAVKFSADGSMVTVVARRSHLPGGAAAVEIAVSDEGVGISPADQEHIFEPFFRGAISEELCLPGSGLGLSIVKRLVDLHGGRVQVESRVGAGTTIRVILPLAPQPPQPASGSLAPGVSAS